MVSYVELYLDEEYVSEISEYGTKFFGMLLL